MEQETLNARAAIEERMRQYAEVALIVAKYQGNSSAVLTGSETRATVSAGSEVEPHTHLTTQYER